MLKIIVILCLLTLSGGAFVRIAQKEKERSKERKRKIESNLEYESEFVFEVARA